MIETLQPASYVPDLSNARLVTFASHIERIADKLPDRVLRAQTNLEQYHEAKLKPKKTDIQLWNERRLKAITKVRKCRKEIAKTIEEMNIRGERSARRNLNEALKHLEVIENEREKVVVGIPSFCSLAPVLVHEKPETLNQA